MWFFAVGASLFDGVRKAVSSTAFAALRATLQPVSGDSGDQTDGTDLRTLWEVDRTVAAIPGFILGIGGRKNGKIWKVAQINRLQKLERVKGIEPSLLEKRPG